VTSIPRALRRGARLFADCRVERITRSAGAVTGVEGRFARPGGGRGPRLLVRAAVVVVAGGAVQTPALLARSGVRSASGQLGRNLTLHPNAKVIALFDEEVTGWKGVHQAYQVREFADEGILLTAVNLPPSLIAMTLPAHGRALGELMACYNQPRAAALLGIRKFIKAFYLDRGGQPFGCNTPVAQNGLAGEWIPKPNAEQPKRYAFFRVEPADPGAPDGLQHGAVLLDYGRGGNRAYDIARILRDYLVRVEPGSDDLLLGKAYFVVARARLASSFFLIERYKPLPGAAPLARR
jgi:hypothetical protein